MRFISIKTRVTLWFTFLMAVIVTLVLVFMLVVSYVDVSYDAEAPLIQVINNNIQDIDYDRGVLDLDRLSFSRHGVYISIYSDDLSPLVGSGSFSFEGDDEFTNGLTRQVTIAGRQYLVRDAHVQDPGGNLWIRGVTLITNRYSVVRVITIISVILFPVLLLIAAVGGWFIARHAFAPVTRITDTVEAIYDGNDLSKRIGLKKGRDEIHRLGATFDRLLDRLEESFESEKRFASDASHELRTPTSVILAECDYALKHETEADELRTSVDVIKRQAERMSSLIGQLLSITRMDRGRQKLNPEDANLSELTDIVCDEVSTAQNKQLRLGKDIAPGVMASIDVGLMTRLVQNLIENAYKYTPEGGLVKVSLKAEGGNAVLIVADTGMGISEEDQKHIWDRFWQADSSRGEDSGSGLGLAMVKQIAELHGGAVTVTSNPGQGSVFTYTMKANVISKQ